MHRRTFLKKLSTALFSGGAAVGGIHGPIKVMGKQSFRPGHAYDINMQYRPLGRTGIRLSEISMGGHLYTMEKKYRYYPGTVIIPEDVDDLQLYADFYKERTEQIACALDVGINFFDISNDREVRQAAVALNRLKRRNDCYLTGDFLRGRYHDERTPDELRESAIEHINKCIRVLKTDRIDLMRIVTFEKWSMEDLAGGIDAFQHLRKEGKARFFGISSHDPQYLMNAINRFDEIDFIATPYSFTHRIAEKELFPLCHAKNIGVITIKPFAGGAFFLPPNNAKKDKRGRKYVSTPPPEVFEKLKSDEKETPAQANLRYILSNPFLTATIPGMNSREEIMENAMVSGRRSLHWGLWKTDDLEYYAHAVRQSLPDRYHWLNRKWTA